MLFSDEKSKIDREALREYVLKQLEDLFELSAQLIIDDKHKKFWDDLHNLIMVTSDEKEKQAYLNVLSQLRHLPDFIKQWKVTAVDSEARFDFFVISKAEEIKSGNEKHDYFWALQIRHDQLVALVRMVDELMKHIREWVELPAKVVIEDAIFQGLTDYSLEDQIYLEAENIHKKRESMINS